MKKEYNYFVESFKNYSEVLRKYNVSASLLYDLECLYTITMTKETYNKQGRACFPKKPTETNTEVIDAENYGNLISSISFFGDRVQKGYTIAGYIPTQLSCVSPDKEIRITRRFRFTRKEL